MISVTNATKAAWEDETSYKEYEITFDDPEYPVTYGNDAIKKDSINITASILSSNRLEFGGCISRKLEITLDGPRSMGGDSNERIPVTLRARANNTEWIDLFAGVTVSQELEENNVLVKYVAYDAFYDMANLDVTDFYNSISAAQNMYSIFEDFCTETGLPAGASVSFANGYESVYLGGYANSIKKISALDFLKQLCQLNACWGEIDGSGYFRTVNINPNDAGTIVTEYDHFKEYSGNPSYFDQVAILPTSESYGARYPSGSRGNKVYVIQDNVFTLNSSDADLEDMGENIIDAMDDVNMSGFSANMMARPWLECGDKLRFPADYSVTGYSDVYILTWSFRGDQSCKHSFSSSLKESLGKEEETTLNTVSGPRDVHYSTSDITGGTTRLATGNIYLVYE